MGAIFVAVLFIALAAMASYRVRAGQAAALFAAGLLIPLALFALAYLSADEQRNRCSDCGEYLGRYWEPWTVAVLSGFVLATWWLGLGLGQALRRLTHRRSRPSGKGSTGKGRSWAPHRK